MARANSRCDIDFVIFLSSSGGVGGGGGGGGVFLVDIKLHKMQNIIRPNALAFVESNSSVSQIPVCTAVSRSDEQNPEHLQPTLSGHVTNRYGQ